MPLHVAVTASELVGAVAAFGRMPNLKRLSDADWRVAGAADFDVFARGQAGVDPA